MNCNELRQAEADSARRAELLTFQAEEIAASNLKPGEDEELRHERDRLANAETLATLSQPVAGPAGGGRGRSPFDL